jgi:hypothetical protein
MPQRDVLSLKCSPEFAAQVRGLAKANGTTVSALLKLALRELLDGRC